MDTVGPPDTHHLSAALGWMELGNLGEAQAELAKVAPELANHPIVLDVKWAICAAKQDWAEALQVAEQLVACAADHASGWLHRAYAARRAPGGGIERAWQLLLPAVDRFPEEATIPYNLACYACQMGQLDEARRWFQRALGVGEKSKLKAMGCSDPDLKALWEEIKNA